MVSQTVESFWGLFYCQDVLVMITFCCDISVCLKENVHKLITVNGGWHLILH